MNYSKYKSKTTNKTDPAKKLQSSFITDITPTRGSDSAISMCILTHSRKALAVCETVWSTLRYRIQLRNLHNNQAEGKTRRQWNAFWPLAPGSQIPNKEHSLKTLTTTHSVSWRWGHITQRIIAGRCVAVGDTKNGLSERFSFTAVFHSSRSVPCAPFRGSLPLLSTGRVSYDHTDWITAKWVDPWHRPLSSPLAKL